MGRWLDLESHRPVTCDILALCPSTPRESSLPQLKAYEMPHVLFAWLLDWDSRSECPLPVGLAA